MQSVHAAPSEVSVPSILHPFLPPCWRRRSAASFFCSFSFRWVLFIYRCVPFPSGVSPQTQSIAFIFAPSGDEKFGDFRVTIDQLHCAKESSPSAVFAFTSAPALPSSCLTDFRCGPFLPQACKAVHSSFFFAVICRTFRD